MNRAVLLALAVYRRWLWRYTPKCRQRPSCSTYALRMVQQHGWLTGLEMTLDRMGPCLGPPKNGERPMAKFPDFGFTESDPRPDQAVDLRPPVPSEAAQQHSSEPDSK